MECVLRLYCFSYNKDFYSNLLLEFPVKFLPNFQKLLQNAIFHHIQEEIITHSFH